MRLPLLALAMVGCADTSTTTDTDPAGIDLEFTYVVELPDHYLNSSPVAGMGGMTPPGFNAPMDVDNTPANNPTTDEGAALGRLLFYDKNLSQNGTVACASCHKAEFGFSDNKVLSKGFDDGDTGRNSMNIVNSRFYFNGKFFWDQRAESLEAQVLMPFQDPVEMGMTLDEVVQRVDEEPRYDELLEATFGDTEVTSDRISKALAQFVRSIVSTTAKYDEGRAQVDGILDPFPNFSASENAGKELFYAPPPLGGLGCAHCHGSDAQVANLAISNGLDATVTDAGYGEVSGVPRDQGTFKVPSLRNIAVTGPYMHDGRFNTLDEVLTHYSDNIQFHETLLPFLTTGDGGVRPLDLTATERADLLAFLNTLTDTKLMEDPKFGDPGW